MAAHESSYTWHPIEDLPGDVASLTRPELSSLAAVWQEQKDKLSTESQHLFLEKLQRQWAIETGIIERLYSLDRGVTQILIERGINSTLIPSEATDKDPELVAAIIGDQKAAIEGLFDFVKCNRPLSTSYISELHALLTRHQTTTVGVDSLGRRVDIKLEKGKYKSLPNNPTRNNGMIHEYCPPEHVASEMDRLIEFYCGHELKGVPPEIGAARLHHRFTQIHPYQDGNGRVARTIASLVFTKAGWFPLVITRDDREKYIAALESADNADLKPLVTLFAAVERQAFVNALSIAGDVQHRQQVHQVIDAARDIFEKRQDAIRREWDQAKAVAKTLQTTAEQRFNEIAGALEKELGTYSSKFEFYVDNEPPGGERGYYFRHQIIQTAKELGYFANPSVYAAWTRLVLRTDTQAEILLSFHGIGHEFRGVVVASLCFFRREEVEKGERELVDLVATSDRVFQINYREKLSEAQGRFLEWLEAALIKALEMWRAGL